MERPPVDADGVGPIDFPGDEEWAKRIAPPTAPPGDQPAPKAVEDLWAGVPGEPPEAPATVRAPPPVDEAALNRLADEAAQSPPGSGKFKKLAEVTPEWETWSTPEADEAFEAAKTAKPGGPVIPPMPQQPFPDVDFGRVPQEQQGGQQQGGAEEVRLLTDILRALEGIKAETGKNAEAIASLKDALEELGTYT
jgi:hypothetical protein